MGTRRSPVRVCGRLHGPGVERVRGCRWRVLPAARAVPDSPERAGGSRAALVAAAAAGCDASHGYHDSVPLRQRDWSRERPVGAAPAPPPARWARCLCPAQRSSGSLRSRRARCSCCRCPAPPRLPGSSGDGPSRPEPPQHRQVIIEFLLY
ncbi:unnamed protein product [Lepidochelys olivacea]